MLPTALPDTISIPDERDTELVPRSDARSEVVSIDPERLWGTPCIIGTRVPIKSLFDYLASGASLEAFLDNFEGVDREVCVRALEIAFDRLMEGLPAARAAR